MPDFNGFTPPTSNFYRLPNDWCDIWRRIRQMQSDGKQSVRIIAPLKIVEYVIAHTWGWSNFDNPVRLSRSDLRLGRRGKRGQRLDRGTGLSSEATLSRGIELALGLGLLEQIKNDDDPARLERWYLPRLCPMEEEETTTFTTFNGFDRPEANYFIVPKSWVDLSANLNSEVLILGIEYFFRHTWGWQMREGEIRWLDADEVANGRRYRSADRQGERYDQGIGYTTRQVREALKQGVQRDLLVWRVREGHKQYALRMDSMTDVEPDGHFDPYEFSLDPLASHNGNSDVKFAVDQEKVVEGGEVNVGDAEESVGGTEKLVGALEKPVGTAGKPVGRTYKDTVNNTLPQDTGTETTPPTHRPGDDDVVGFQQNQLIFFQSELTNGNLGPPRQLTLAQATSIILIEAGEWYWSERDLNRSDKTVRHYSPQEIAAQETLDSYLLGDNGVILDDGQTYQVVSLVEMARLQSAPHSPCTFYLDMWHFLDLPRPPYEMAHRANMRRQKLAQLQQQAEAWGDPDLLAALEKIDISPDVARSLVAHYDYAVVGSWLRVLRAKPDGIKNMAGVLITRLKQGIAPPGAMMEVIECTPDRLPANGQPGKPTGNIEPVLARIANLLTALRAELQALDGVEPDPRLSKLTAIFQQAQNIMGAQ